MNLVAVAYLGSYFLSLLGNAIAAVALPLIVLQTTGSVLGAGAVAAATALPAVVAGVLMGVVIDRIDRRFSSVLTDLISGASIAALPLVDLVTDVNVGWFALFGLIGSLGDVPGMTAREALVPAIVRHGGMEAERLVGLRESTGALAVILGPAAAGGLMAAFDGATVLWVTAVTSLAAALATLLLPRSIGTIRREEHGAEPGTSWSQLREGWTLLFRTSPFLLTTTAMNTVLVAVLAAMQSLVLPVHFTAIGAPGRLGFILSAIAAGSLVGGVLFAVLGRRGSRHAWFLVGLAGTAAGFGVVGALPPLWAIFSGAVAMGVASGALGSLLGVPMLERIPEHMRGRVLGTQNAIMTAAAPLGIVAAAFAAHHGGNVFAGLALVAVWLVAALLAALAPALRSLGPVEDVPEWSMRSAELAAVAGVTVRTLRHYHQVGVLPEPPRRSNGYREYDVRDLVRVLRIRRLASLGIPLDRMAEILDGDAAPDALLDELDRELESRIAELVAQRELVAQIRRERLAPDLPPDFGRVSSRLEDPRSERDLSVLLAHLTDDPTRARLVSYYDRATSPEMIASSDALVRRFSALAPDSSNAEIEAVAAHFVEQIAVLDPPLDLGLVDERRSRALLDGYLRSHHNAAQVAVLDRVAARLG